MFMLLVIMDIVHYFIAPTGSLHVSKNKQKTKKINVALLV